MLFFSFPGLSWFLLYTQLCPPGFTSSGNVLIQRRHLQYRVGLHICFLLTYFPVPLLIMKVYPTQRIHSFFSSSSRLVEVRNSDSFGKWMKTIELILKNKSKQKPGPQPSSWTCQFFWISAVPLTVRNPWLWATKISQWCSAEKLYYVYWSCLPSSEWDKNEGDPVTSSKSSFTKQLCSNATVVFWFVWTWATALIKLN